MKAGEAAEACARCMQGGVGELDPRPAGDPLGGYAAREAAEVAPGTLACAKGGEAAFARAQLSIGRATTAGGRLRRLRRNTRPRLLPWSVATARQLR